MNVSENYTDIDVSFDMLAVKNKINNVPTSSALRAAEDLAANLLEPLREHFNFRIVSWYRSEALEREYSKHSYFNWCRERRLSVGEDRNWFEYLKEKQHITGAAVSIVSPDIEAIFEWLQDQKFDILQMRGSYLHVSFVLNANRRMILK